MLIWIPPELIARFKAIVESYDNLATLRTENPALHHLRLYFAPGSAADVHALIDSLAAEFSIRHISAPPRSPNPIVLPSRNLNR